MRPLLRFLRLVLELQGAIVLDGKPIPEEGGVEIRVRRHAHAKPRCPECRRVLRGRIVPIERRWRHLDVMKMKTFIAATIREGWCPRHERRVEGVPWAHPAARHTHAFDRAVASLVQVADKSAAARMFDAAWRTVGRIVHRVVASLLPEDRLEGLEFIGVDETSYKRGHRYLTVVSSLITGRVVWIGEGKSEATPSAFFAGIRPERAGQSKLVAMEMGEAYQASVQAHAPQADIVFDRFHVAQLLLSAIDDVRREEVRKVQEPARNALKRTRFALLRNPKHRTPRDEDAIRRVEAGNRRLARAYQLRVDFEDLWDCGNEEDAREFLARRTRSALRSRQRPPRRFATAVRRYQHGILGIFRWWGTTNAVLEGTANRIELAIHRAYGFHSVEALMAMVYLCCGGLRL
jgi:transposase